jgi:hypothetical protein
MEETKNKIPDFYKDLAECSAAVILTVHKSKIIGQPNEVKIHFDKVGEKDFSAVGKMLISSGLQLIP